MVLGVVGSLLQVVVSSANSGITATPSIKQREPVRKTVAVQGENDIEYFFALAAPWRREGESGHGDTKKLYTTSEQVVERDDVQVTPR